MQVSIKEFAVGMEVKSKGVGFEVRDTAGKFLGDCYITMTGVEWCKGKTVQGNGVKINWATFIKETDDR